MLVEVQNLKKLFKISRHELLHAVDGVTFSIAKEEVLGLVGESGSGKTTLGKTLIGIHPKTSGAVNFQGKLCPEVYGKNDFKRQAKDIQIIFQDPYNSLNPRMTIQEIIAEGLLLKGNGRLSKVKDKVAFWLERVGLNPDHMSRYPHEFSGGQRQRAGIARALIVEPKFVVCDEPISALDVSVQAQIVQLLAELKDSMGLTLLFIAHDLSMVRYVSDRMAVMYLGSLIEIGPSDKVYFEPKHPYTQALVEANPEPDPVIERQHRTRLIKGEIPTPINLKEGCRFVGRCPIAEARCRVETPLLREISEDRQVACHLV